MRKTLYIAICVFLFASDASARNIIEQVIPQAERIGNARLSVLFWDVYDIELYAPSNQWSPQKPYMLTLHYLRNISGIDIADKSVEQLRKLGIRNEIKLAAWHGAMRDIFPNVKKGTSLTGLHIPNGPAHFYHDDKHIGTINDPEFGKWFFGIWLHENTSKPKLRQQLLGLE